VATDGDLRHLTSEQIQEFLDRGLTPQEEARVQEHLSVCPRCQGELEGWSLLFSDLGSLEEISPGPPGGHGPSFDTKASGRPGQGLVRSRGSRRDTPNPSSTRSNSGLPGWDSPGRRSRRSHGPPGRLRTLPRGSQGLGGDLRFPGSAGAVRSCPGICRKGHGPSPDPSSATGAVGYGRGSGPGMGKRVPPPDPPRMGCGRWDRIGPHHHNGGFGLSRILTSPSLCGEFHDIRLMEGFGPLFVPFLCRGWCRGG